MSARVRRWGGASRGRLQATGKLIGPKLLCVAFGIERTAFIGKASVFSDNGHSPRADRKESRKTGQRVRRDVNVDNLPEPQVRKVIAATEAPMNPGFSTTAKDLKACDWQLGPGQPTLVMDQFSAEDFHMVVDDHADVHINSKDGRLYLGWSPLSRPGTDGEGWKIAVTGTATVPGYSISFDTETPADIVAAAVTCVLEATRPR